MPPLLAVCPPPGLPTPDSPVLTLARLADVLNVSIGTAISLCRARKIPHYRIGGEYRIVWSEVLPYLIAMRVTPINKGAA